MENISINELKEISKHVGDIEIIKNYVLAPNQVRNSVCKMAEKGMYVGKFLKTYLNLASNEEDKNDNSDEKTINFSDVLVKGVDKITFEEDIDENIKNELISHFSDYISDISSDVCSDIDKEFIEFLNEASYEYLDKICRNSEMLKEGYISYSRPQDIANTAIRILNIIVSESYSKSLKQLMHGDSPDCKKEAFNRVNKLIEYFSYNNQPGLGKEDYISIKNHIDIALAHSGEMDILLNKERINNIPYLHNAKFARYILDEYQQLVREYGGELSGKIRKLVIKLSNPKYKDSLKKILEYYHVNCKDAQEKYAKIDCTLGHESIDIEHLILITEYGFSTSINEMIEKVKSVEELNSVLGELPIDPKEKIDPNGEIKTYKFANEDKKDE